MLTETQSLLMQSIPSAIIFTLGIYNLIHPRLPFKEIFTIFFIMLIGVELSAFVYMPLILFSVFATFAYMYFMHRSTPIILCVPIFSYLIGALCDNLIGLFFEFFLTLIQKLFITPLNISAYWHFLKYYCYT